VTRTKGAGPEQINAVLQEYFEELRKYLAELEKERSASQGESAAAEAKKRSLLSVALLKGDIIESVGMMKREGDPIESLVKKVAELVPYTPEQITKDITKWVKQGLLKYTSKDGHLVWGWS